MEATRCCIVVRTLLLVGLRIMVVITMIMVLGGQIRITSISVVLLLLR